MSVRTTCGQCLGACGIIVDDDLTVRGDDSHPITRGYVCANGKASTALLRSDRRLRRASVRGREVALESALDAAASAILNTRARYGADSVALYFGAGDPAGSLAFLSAAGFLQGIGSRSHYNVIGLEATHRSVVAREMLGSPLHVLRADLEHASGLLALGTNPAISNDEGGLASALDALAKRRGTIVVLDPRRTELARRAAVHLAIKPGTDAEVLLAIIHVLFEEQRVIANPTIAFDGVERLRDLARSMPPERAAAIADVPSEAIVKAARALSRVRPVTSISRLGTAMSRRASVNEWLAWSIVALLGGIGAEGGLLLNDGYIDFAAMLARGPRHAHAVLGILPPADLADAILSGSVCTLIVVAADPVESIPNAAKVRKALRALDDLIVLDIAPTATTAIASVVLPTAHHLEKEDTFLLLPDRLPQRWAGLSKPVRPPPGDARSEVELFLELGRRVRAPVFGSRAIDATVRAAAMLDPGTAAFERAALRVVLPLLTRFSLTRKRLERGVDAARLRPTSVRELSSRPGGRIDLAPPAFAAQVESEVVGDRTDDPDALTLVTCTRSRDFINGKTRIVGQAADGARLAMSAAEASARGFEDGERVVVRTSTGEMFAVLKLDPALRRGVAYVFFGTEGLNRITEDSVRDPHSQIPAMANVRCSVRRAVEAHHEKA